MAWWQWILAVLAGLGILAVGLMELCAYIARKVLHPVSKRKPLYQWPDQYKMPYEDVSFLTEDKVQLKGWFIPCDDSEKTIILMHGWGMNRSDILKNTYYLHDLGFNLLYFDFRALGESGGKVSSIGYLETRDAQAAILFLQETRPESCKKIGLYGLSMGAMVAVSEGARNPAVNCVVAEACYYSFRRVVARWAWVHYRVPPFPLIPMVLHYVRRYLRVNPERFSPKYNVAKIAPRPVFIIHGRYDNIVPPFQAKLLFKHAGEPKEIWLVPGAKHNKCAELGGFEYKQRLSNFFRRYL